MSRTPLILAAVCWSFAAFPPPAAAADESVQASFRTRAPEVLKKLKADKYTNVGVLKFLVRVGDGPLLDDAGGLNTTLANQMQSALALANPDETFGILDDPSGFVVANAMTDANHRQPDGRKAFFDRDFDLAWGSGKVKPSGFLTGTATVAANRKAVSFKLEVFDRTGELKPVIADWTAATDPELLADLGHSYTVPAARRKALVSGDTAAVKEVRAEVIAALRPAPPVTPRDAPPPPPLDALADCPVRWTVRYNNKVVRPSGDTLPEPKPGDKVTFELDNPTADTYAAVLLVNGENTLYQEQLAPIACRKWVLEPMTKTEVTGFQTDNRKATPFEVTTPDDPTADAVRYGPHAGTFRLVVYPGRTQKTDERPPAGAISDVMAIALVARGTRPAGGKPQTLAAYQAALKLRHKDAANARGLIVKGSGVEKSETERVVFVPTSDQPVSDISLKYHEAK